MHRASNASRWAIATVVAALALTAGYVTAQQLPSQKNCINRMNKAGSKVAKAQGKSVAACLKDAGRGNLPPGQDAQACLTADAKGRVAKAKSITDATELSYCGALPPGFGYAGAAAVNDAAIEEVLALTADVYGVDLSGSVIDASTDKAGATCQSKVQKALDRIMHTKVKEFLKCKKDGLKSDSIVSAATLTDCFDRIIDDPKQKVSKTVTRLADTIATACSGVAAATAFPGACAGAGDVTSCIDALVECRTCRMLDQMDAVERDCDLFDDGAANASCVTPLDTTTTTTTTLPPVCGNGNVESGEACDDGNTADGDCCSATCTYEAASSPCDDGNVCTDDQCDGAGACLPVADNVVSCDDGVFCNGVDTCDAGACSVHAGLSCDDGISCTTDSCDEGGDTCVNAPDDLACDDGIACTSDTCDTGLGCVNTPLASQCDDENGCTDDVCNPLVGCEWPFNSAPCSDSLFCNGADTCAGGTCAVHAGDPCPGADGDGNCAEVCNEATDDCSLPDPNGSACNDGVFCNGTDTCQAGSCNTHAGNPCPGADGDADCSETCNETTDDCSANDPAASACNDGIFCNGADTCLAGACSVHAGDPCDGPDGDGDCSETCDEGADACTGNDPVGLGCDDGSCLPCGNGQSCLVGSGCDSGVCTGGSCQAPTCGDGVQNGSETDVDCGGGSCPPCTPGDGCSSASDCTSGVCSGGICQAPTCSDGVQNQNESDTDCGGVCADCPPGSSCNAGSDCTSNICSGGTCTTPNCGDGVKNQNESDVDCGGVCADCSLGKTCNSGADCQTNSCNGGICRCPSTLFTFNISSNSGGVFDSAEWPGGSAAQSVPGGCSVTIKRPGDNIDLVCALGGGGFAVTGRTGFSNCFGTGGEDGDGCQVLSCPPAGIGSCCEARPSCSAALNGSGSARYFVQCNP